MGYAVAEAAARRGARVILVSGPTSLDVPAGVDRIDVRTAEEMHRAVAEKFPECSIAIFAAAVADYRPATKFEQKIKRDKEPCHSIAGTDDRIFWPAWRKNKGERLIVGFAAETEPSPKTRARNLPQRTPT